VDWDAYLFNRPKVAFNPRLLRQWQLFKMCTNGISGLWMSHLVDAAANVMGASYPASAVALGGIYLWKDGREHTDVFHALLDYPEGFLFDWEMCLTNSAGTHYTIHGQNGTIDMENLTYSGNGGVGDKKIADGKLENIPDENHMANWLDCVRSRQKPTADIEIGHQHAVATIMAAESLESGRRVTYDKAARKLV
jgi:predicted dehydrogenase